MIELFRPDRCQQAQETEESRTEQAEPKNGPAMDWRHMHIRPDQHGQPDGKANADRPRYGRSDQGSHEFTHGYRRHQKTGRASCRERVCQYVSVSVVTEPFKKKKHTRRVSKIITKTKNK